ncbi:hypothetical protein BGZ80_005067 [Entomortierella chlamydospora]|uniref:Uncharacterized protein n=1 Tax=Entomortierella chlamydospora TaxID=101097 RepID=A0A9P6N0Z4_9FUNG|nr:hypothetical protein BGZ79_006132 [Entomortierella chlamydospora]KAG0019916.1 hypothetical protein BGZ80_005067 [Entomortierella chlamydospora]
MSADNAVNATVPQTNVTLGFICQESFYENNTSSCMRYSKLKACIKDGTMNHLNFYCVGQDTISIGGSGPSPLPTTFNMTVFNCTMDSCPIEAPAENSTKPAGGKKGNGNNSSSSASKSDAFKNNDKKLTLSGLLVLVLMASQLALM